MSEQRNESPAASARGWFTVEAGAFLRGQIRREIEGAAWRAGLNIETNESRGLLESVYRFTVRGPKASVTAFLRAAEKWVKEVESSV